MSILCHLLATKEQKKFTHMCLYVLDTLYTEKKCARIRTHMSSYTGTYIRSKLQIYRINEKMGWLNSTEKLEMALFSLFNEKHLRTVSRLIWVIGPSLFWQLATPWTNVFMSTIRTIPRYFHILCIPRSLSKIIPNSLWPKLLTSLWRYS